MTGFEDGEPYAKYRTFPLACAVEYNSIAGKKIDVTHTFTTYKTDKERRAAEKNIKETPNFQIGDDFRLGGEVVGGGGTQLVPGALPQPTDIPGNGNGTPSSVAQSSDSGLSTGAIAGVAVGAGVVVLALVGGLIWFLVLRRKPSEKKRGRGDDYDEKKSVAFLKDGEVEQAHAAESDISPSSDNDSRRRISANGIGMALTSNTDVPPSVTTSPKPPQIPSPDSRPGSSLAVPAAVAHLVEDGMTEADIRRLEEEERQLDAEIERTNRH